MAFIAQIQSPGLKLTIEQVKHLLNQNNRKNLFEIFGYDFMIDETGKAWLIEVNTNPCLEESSAILRQYIPRMLDDAFKLTVDKIWKKPRQKVENRLENASDLSKSQNIKPTKLTKAKEEIQGETQKFEVFKVDGYADDENMWVEI